MKQLALRLLTFLFTVLIPFLAFAQMRPIDKVYIVEGIVADRETLIIVPSAILYNDSLGIITTSDERGYFKIVVPYGLIKRRQTIPIDIVKTGYKRNGSGFSYNPVKPDTSHTNDDLRGIWNYDVKIFLMASNESQSSSTVMAHAPAREGVHGYAVIKLAFDEAVASELRDRKFAQLKAGNEKIYFLVNGQIGLATSKYDMFVEDKLSFVYLDDKKVKLSDINKLARRSEFILDDAKTQALSKKYGKDTFAFVTNNQFLETPKK